MRPVRGRQAALTNSPDMCAGGSQPDGDGSGDDRDAREESAAEESAPDSSSVESTESSEHGPRPVSAEEREKKERLERALRRYRATLRNEAESDASGFSAEHYRSQKPPHW